MEHRPPHPAKSYLRRIMWLLSAIGIQTLPLSALADYPRAFIWGLAGSESIGRIDAMLPWIAPDCNHLTFADIQAEVGGDYAWYVGAGTGYRGIACQRIFGGYVFLDRNVKEHQFFDNHNDQFYVLNPGIETIGCRWDARINGYIPVSNHIKRGPSFFNINDTCGNNFNCDTSTFSGHQQFAPKYHRFEEIGPGIDAELGFHLPRFQNFSLYGGGYYYHLKEADHHIGGVEGRAVLPVSPVLAFTVEASYDRWQKGAVVGGIRFQIGHAPCCQLTLRDHLYDPIIRNIATVRSGSGIPIVRGTKNEGPKLYRDNIYFFANNGGTAYTGPGTGTYENPLSADQLTQFTVDNIAAITASANLYFNTGTYVIRSTGPMPAPNAHISLPGGMSLYGRTADYKCSAVGTARPDLLGGFDLFAGNNTFDSVIIYNAMTDPGASTDLVTINAQGAPNVFICNSEIDAIINVTGDNTLSLSVTGITANNSSITIDPSTVNTQVTVGGNNTLTGTILAAGIGTNGITSVATGFAGNTFAIANSLVAANIVVGGANIGPALFATGIGVNNIAATSNTDFQNNNFAIGGGQVLSGVSVTGTNNTNSNICTTGIGTNALSETANFDNNNFFIHDSTVSSTATSGLNNFIISSTAIGNNCTAAATANFSGNVFDIEETQLTASATVNGDNAFAFALGIGNNLTAALSAAKSDFNDNNFIISNNKIMATASTAGDNLLQNFSVGIGENTLDTETVINFSHNNFIITCTLIQGVSIAGSNEFVAVNFAGGIAINQDFAPGFDFNFEANHFVISDSQINASTVIQNDNNFLNSAVGLGENLVTISGSATNQFNNNSFVISNTTINSFAMVGGDNVANFGFPAANESVGIGSNMYSSSSSFSSNQIILDRCVVNATAIIQGRNDASANLTTSIGSNAVLDSSSVFEANNIMLTCSILTSTATVGSNIDSAANSATGVGGNTFSAGTVDFNDSTVDITQSFVGVFATVTGNNAAGSTNSAIGLSATSGVFNLIENIFQITAVKGSGVPSMAQATVTPPPTIVNIIQTIFRVFSN
jgi:hypothetical protein